MVYNGETSSEHYDGSCSPIQNVPFGPEDAEVLFLLVYSCLFRFQRNFLKRGIEDKLVFQFFPRLLQALKTLSRTGLLDDAVEALRQIPMVREDLAGLKDEDVAAATLITPEVSSIEIVF